MYAIQLCRKRETNEGREEGGGRREMKREGSECVCKKEREREREKEK